MCSGLGQTFVMRGRQSYTSGKYGKPRAPTVERMIDSLEYAHVYALLYPSREQLVKYVPLLVAHFSDFGMEVHVVRKVTQLALSQR